MSLDLHLPHIISLGAGVQSSTMALMAAKGEITPMPVLAIFADTQAEPESVYKWLSFLETNLPFPVRRVTAGNLTKNSLKVGKSKITGKRYMQTLIPFFTLSDDGKKGMLWRKCTSSYKVRVIQREVKHFLGIAGKRLPTEKVCRQWIGISTDELQRIKASNVPYIANRFPLIENKISRNDCLQWMHDNRFPLPPRSACVYCPYHSNDEWRRLIKNEPDEFIKAVEFEKQIHKVWAEKDEVLESKPFLHPDRIPLSDVDFNKTRAVSDNYDFNAECDGMCGV